MMFSRISLRFVACAICTATVNVGIATAGPMYVFLVTDPTTTAGFGIPASNGMVVDSTKSGPGSFHLYAVDDVTGSFGIRSYNVKLNGTITSFSNRSPIGSWNDVGQTGPFTEGFSDIRIASAATGITSGGLGLANTVQIGGIGISASDLVANTPAAASFSGVTSGQWGNYNDGAPTQGLVGPSRFRNAIFLAEGSYTGAPPTIDTTTTTNDNGTGFNYFTTNPSSGIPHSASVGTILALNPFVPEPATLTLLGSALLVMGGLVGRRRS